LALFTGYVLRYDGTGQAADTIAEHLLLKIPLIGEGLNRFLMATTDEGLNRVYLLHVVLTTFLWGVGTWYHTRRVILSQRIFLSITVITIIIALLFHAPIDLPGENIDLIQGPWFFLGIQELLRFFAPLEAGILYPLIPIIIFSSLSWMSNRKIPLLLLTGWLVTYLGLSLAGWFRSA
jgi:ubiquinol-cytochrome c reductase cytochrome b subunit